MRRLWVASMAIPFISDEPEMVMVLSGAMLPVAVFAL